MQARETRGGATMCRPLEPWPAPYHGAVDVHLDVSRSTAFGGLHVHEGKAHLR